MWKKAVLLMAISTCMVGNVVAQSIIDVHCHNILPFYMEVLEKHNARWMKAFLSRHGMSVHIWNSWRKPA